MNGLLAPLNCHESEIMITAERAANEALGGGCHVPIAVYSEIHGDSLHVRGLVSELDGSRILRSECQGPWQEAKDLGNQIARDLLGQGAGEILASVYGD